MEYLIWTYRNIAIKEKNKPKRRNHEQMYWCDMNTRPFKVWDTLITDAIYRSWTSLVHGDSHQPSVCESGLSLVGRISPTTAGIGDLAPSACGKWLVPGNDRACEDTPQGVSQTNDILHAAASTRRLGLSPAWKSKEGNCGLQDDGQSRASHRGGRDRRWPGGLSSAPSSSRHALL
jgi:hypothetical protein